MVKDEKDGSILHTTDFSVQYWTATKSQISFLHISSLTNRKYLHGDTVLPSYIINQPVSKLYSTYSIRTS